MDQATGRTAQEERSLGDLLADLTRQISTLVRQEIALARAETVSELKGAARGGGMVAIGGVLVHAGALAVLAAIALVLIQAGVTPWLAALLVGVVVAAIGAALIGSGRSAIAATDLTPRRTIETIKDDATMAKEHVK